MVPPPTDQPDQPAADQTGSFSDTGQQQDAEPTGDHREQPQQPVAITGDTFDLSAALREAFGDRYEVGPQLGRGGFGSVYRAHDLRLNRAVALKVSFGITSDPDQLLREARALAQLRHEGIVAVYDVAVAGRCCLVVSELLPGASLALWAETNRPAATEAVRIAAAVADALAHAHAKSIIHRDVKPSNIVFADGLRPVLVDFGLALSDLDTATERGVVSGTPAFMAPEQAGGRAHRPDGRTDIYGLAATLYAILCGRAPFRGRNHADIMRQVCEDEPQPPRQLRPDLSVELERVCMKALSKLPGDRFTTAADFAEALRCSVAPAPPTAPVPTVPPPVVEKPVAPPPSVANAPSVRGPRTERRQVTLLHCAFEAPGGEDDPMDRVAAFQAACADAAAAHGGLVLQGAGTTFLACFGYPVAREDAPRQAVRAALTILKRADLVPVAVVGTGVATVTEQPPAAPVLVGDVVTACSTLLAQGTRTGVTVTESTYRLIEGFFDCETAGDVRPRGVQPVPVFSVRAEREARNRVEAADPARLAPLIGRDREVELLKERWELTSEGVQNVLLLVADPGLGKSRLVRVLRDHVRNRPHDASAHESTRTQVGGAAVIEWYCSPYHAGSPFFPVIDYFDRAYQLSREPDPARRLDQLVSRLREDGVHDAEDQALFAAMLSVPTGDRLPALALNPEKQREKTQDALLAWLNARAEYAPVLFVVEDLHWVDPSTEGLLGQFVERGGEARVLALFTFRPEYDPPWKGKAIQTQVALNRLTRGQVAEMVRAQAGASVPQATVDLIAERTDGVPLFVEEFARALAERGSDVSATIPATLHDLLLARLDRMASNREVVQLGAVIGRTFAHSVIRAATSLDETTLRSELDKLVGAGLLFAKGTGERATYTFKHALIQDAAYQSMVKKTRQQFHRSVAEKLEAQFADVAETQPELLARHFTEAGVAQRAVDYWLKAGQRARERSAYREAIRHFNRGLELIPQLPESVARDRWELQFQIPLSTVTTMACGWGDPGLEATYKRARELCERIGPDAPKFHVTWGLWAWRVLRAELDIANDLVADLEAQAATLDDGYKMEAGFALSCTSLFRGEFERNIAHGPSALTKYDAERCAFHAKFTGSNAFSTISAFYGWSHAIRGRYETAVKVAEDALRVALDTRDKYSEEYVRYHLGCVQQHYRMGTAARASGVEVIAIGTEHGFGMWVALGTLCQGAGMVIEGRAVRAGLDLIGAGIAGSKGAGAELGLSNYLAISAEGYRAITQPERAWAVLEDAFAMVARTAERFQLSNLHRIRGDLLLDHGTVESAADAEAEYRRAIEVAREQTALSWELRAALPLARLWITNGKNAEARALVANISGRFTESLQTPDLLAARALLDELC